MLSRRETRMAAPSTPLSPRETEVIVLGIGGHAKVVISALQALGYIVVEAYDDDAALWGAQLLGVPVVGPLASIVPSHRPAVIGFGDNHVRRRVAAQLPLQWLTVVHPSAFVHPSAQMGAGTVVFAGAIVQPDARIGRHAIVNTGASVDHDCQLGDFVHVSPGVHLAGSAHLEDGVFLGIGSVTTPGVRIGAWTTVGAGSVVVRDLPAGMIAMGAPAHHQMRPNPASAHSDAPAPTPELQPEPGRVLASQTPDQTLGQTPDAQSAPRRQREDIVAQFIAPDDTRWTEFLQQTPHDFYHVPAYVQLEAQQNEGEAVAFHARLGNAQFLLPLILKRPPFTRDMAPAWQDATSPYGYACPLLSPAGDEQSLDLFLHAFREAAALRNIVTAFLRLHPLLPLPTQPLEKYGQVARHGQTVYLDLSEAEADVSPHVNRNHRRDIRKLHDAGFRVTLNQWEYYDSFVEIYRSTMQRLNAGDMYFFKGDYFERLRDALGESMSLALVFSPRGELAAGGLFIETCGIIQYHLSGTAEEFLRLSPTKIMVHWARDWAKERGNKFLHIGGGVGGREDSLFHFKAGFSRHRADFHTYRMVLDPPKYQQLVERWRQSGGQLQSAEDFFPLYALPIAALPIASSPVARLDEKLITSKF